MIWALRILSGTLEVFFLAAPFILFGLLLGGILHVMLSRERIQRWMGHAGLLGVSTAACFGIPLPLCSCSVVPVAMELRRKGASRPSVLSFMITTPESGVDSILVTWGLLGPLMAVARPLASFVTALVAGTIAIAAPDGDESGPRESAASEDEHDHAHAEMIDSEADVIGPRRLWHSLLAFRRERRMRLRPPDSPALPPAPVDAVPLRQIVRSVVQYAFVDLLDDLAFWLVVGLVAAGVISALVPDDLVARGFGSGIVPMLVMLAMGVPLYICASASTPVASALIAKGLSPGAGLVFLLAGPATNAASLVLLTRNFGASFVRIYLASVSLGALICGLALDWFLAATGWRIVPVIAAEGMAGSNILLWFGFWLSFVLLFGLLVWRLWAGAWQQGWHDLREHLENLFGSMVNDGGGSLPDWPRLRRRIAQAGAMLVVTLWSLSGFTQIPPGSVGFGMLFGQITWPDLAPGLHWTPPFPFGRCDVLDAARPRKADVGYRTDVKLIAQRREMARLASPQQWHSPVTAMNSDVREASYIAGDENLLEVSFTVHFLVKDAAAFLYRVENVSDLISQYALTSARTYVAQNGFDDLLTDGRVELEKVVADGVQASLDGLGGGVQITSVHVVDIHPPQEAVFAFRDVSSAREDRETRIHTARSRLAGETPRARGRAALEMAQAASAAASRKTEAVAQAESFSARAAAYAASRKILGELLWFEHTERALADKDKMIIPKGSAGRNLVLWKGTPPMLPSGGGR